MRIKLVLPTIYDENGKLVRVKKALLPNLTIIYLAGMVPKQHQVSVIEESVKEIDFNQPLDLVGISLNTSNAERAYQLAGEFRKRGTKVVFGGIHASSNTSRKGSS